MTDAERSVGRAGAPGDEAERSECTPAAARGELRLPALVVVLALLTVAFLRVLPQDLRLQELLTRPFRPDETTLRERQYAALRAKDPALGSILPVPSDGQEKAGRWAALKGGSKHPGGTTRRETLVLMIGPCTRCSLSGVQVLDGFCKQHPEVAGVVVSPSPSEAAEQFRRENHLGLRIVSDPGGRLARRYNAAWTPRAYLLSTSGALLWCQPDWRVDLVGVLSDMGRGGA